MGEGDLVAHRFELIDGPLFCSLRVESGEVVGASGVYLRDACAIALRKAVAAILEPTALKWTAEPSSEVRQLRLWGDGTSIGLGPTWSTTSSSQTSGAQHVAQRML